jgi:AcrR family transcriptional regulator
MVVLMTNREALLEAALASLQDKGYAETTAREVANRAGVSLGAIGYHYGTLKRNLRRWRSSAPR